MRQYKRRYKVFGRGFKPKERINLFKKFNYYRLNSNGFALIREHTHPNIRLTVCKSGFGRMRFVNLSWMIAARNGTIDMTFRVKYIPLNKVFPYKPRFVRVL